MVFFSEPVINQIWDDEFVYDIACFSLQFQFQCPSTFTLRSSNFASSHHSAIAPWRIPIASFSDHLLLLTHSSFFPLPAPLAPLPLECLAHFKKTSDQAPFRKSNKIRTVILFSSTIAHSVWRQLLNDKERSWNNTSLGGLKRTA